MKLLSKYNRVNIIATIIVLLLSAVLYYFFIEAVLIHQLDKNLKVEEREITNYIKENNQLPEPSDYKDEQEVYTLSNAEVKRTFSSVSFYNEHHKEYKPYRQLEFPVTVNGKLYKVDVRKSQEETEDIVQLILKITLGMVVILLTTLFVINRFVLSKLWKPFNSTLHQIKKFNLSGKDEVKLEPTNINEFAELNEAVNTMTKRVSHDYNEIKSFTENASHEIQTPLAIISSKLELLSQAESLKEEQMNIIQSISETTKRLSKLNQSLILLTKIDNQQFRETEELDMSRLTQLHLNNYEELLQANEITLTKKIEEGVHIIMNETLAEILIINLLTNAIKHNIKKGSIKVELTKKYLMVSNTGKKPDIDPALYFERFKKESSSIDSLGLGLSIVKKICEAYGFEINYRYEEMLHILTVSF
jgi:signal transduction histidine kinase